MSSIFTRYHEQSASKLILSFYCQPTPNYTCPRYPEKYRICPGIPRYRRKLGQVGVLDWQLKIKAIFERLLVGMTYTGLRMIPSITQLKNEQLLHAGSTLKCSGILARSVNNLIYLDVDDAYIHRLFPLLTQSGINKPNYFAKGMAGAHISVIYPEENRVFNPQDLGKEYFFKIKELVIAEMNLKKYFVLLATCPDLVQLRAKYGLSKQLYFKGYWIDLHITIAVSQLNKKL